MKFDPWRAPFSGLAYFFTRPSLWGWAFLSTVLSLALTFFFCFKAIQWSFPSNQGTWGVYFWHLMQSIGWGLFTLVMMVSLVFPLIFNACFSQGFCRLLRQEGILHAEEGMGAAFLSSFSVFFRTMKWRILWPLLLLLSIFFLPFLTLFLALIAANHLAVIEGADLSLSLFGLSGKERGDWINRQGIDCFTAAISGSLLSSLLALTGVGWIFWIPSIYCGCFLWIKTQFGKKV